MINRAKKDIWTLSHIKGVAAEFLCANSFKGVYPGLYDYARHRNWHSQLMYSTPDGVLVTKEGEKRKRRKNWTRESALEVAKRFATCQELLAGNKSVHEYGRVNNLLESWFPTDCPRRKRKWNHSDVKEEAQKYSTRGQFYAESSGAYAYARRHNMLDDLFPKSI